MIRFLLTVLSNLVMAAVALLLADWWLHEWVTLHLGGFFVAVAVFTVAQAILAPFVFNMARQYASAVLGGIGLVSTFLALWVASLFPGGVEVRGLGWVLAPLLLWIVTALGGWIVVGLVLEKYLVKREKRRLIERSAR